MTVTGRAPGRGLAAGADTRSGAATAGSRAARSLIAVLLLAAAALDLTRCGLVLATARHPAPATGLVAAGLAAAAFSSWTARGCLARWRWPPWAALVIGAASAPQAAASGFAAPYTVPDTATAALGILLAGQSLAVLAEGPPPSGHGGVARTALNTGASWWRRRRHELPLADHDLATPGDRDGGLDATLLAAIWHLPRRQREVIALRIFLDLDTATIARQLGIEAGTVRMHLPHWHQA